MSVVIKAPSSGHLQLEKDVQSEDLINAKKGASEKECFFTQRIVTSGDASAIQDQVSSAVKQELFSVPSEESERFEETLYPGHDSDQDSYKIKEQALGELCIGETKCYLESDPIDGTVCNSELLQEQFHMDTVTSQMHDPCKKDLLHLKKHPVDQDEFSTTSLYGQIKGNDCQKQSNLKDNNMSASKILVDKSNDLTMPVELIEDNIDACTSIESQGSFNLCNNIHSQECSETMSPTNKRDKHLQTNKYDGKTSTPKIASDIEHLNASTNSSASESDKTVKMCSLDFQAKSTAIGLSRPDSTRNGKRKNVSEMPKCRKLASLYETEIVSHKLEFVEEENLSEQEESSEDDSLDSPVTYSRDRLDHRKERHQYVSDQLDPDVLHLLEMHLRKQQLVEIKEEREEELLDVHINKEKSRSETFKLLRNISPVLDMVLEEPELEHSGDTLEEGSKTPSDIDSDDSSNSCAVELGLMESLQNDLMSKSSKIDKHEIATILQTPSSDISTKENKDKQKVAVCNNNDEKIYCETIKNKEAKTPREETEDSFNLQMDELQKPVDGIVTSGFNSGSTSVENGHDLEASLEDDKSKSWERLNNVPHKDAEAEKDSMEEVDHLNQSTNIRSGNKDLNLDVSHEGVSDSEAGVAYTGIALPESKDDAFAATESECVKTENSSKEQCPTLDGNLKPHDLIVPSLDGNMSLPIVSQSTDNYFPNPTDNCITDEVSTEQHDDVGKPTEGENIDQTDHKEELKAVNKGNSSEPSLCSPADMSTLRLDLEEKILSILEKAHAADCRSSHLQAGAELLWKESIELRNECKSLSKEAAELLSLFNKQSVVHRQPRKQSSIRTRTVGSLTSTTDTKPSNKETLNFNSKNDSRNINKGEDQLKFLSKKYNFLREEAPEIMRELHVLQQDLKSLPSQHNKPMSILYNLLWGGLMTGGALLLAWWSTKHLG